MRALLLGGTKRYLPLVAPAQRLAQLVHMVVEIQLGYEVPYSGRETPSAQALETPVQQHVLLHGEKVEQHVVLRAEAQHAVEIIRHLRDVVSKQ